MPARRGLAAKQLACILAASDAMAPRLGVLDRGSDGVTKALCANRSLPFHDRGAACVWTSSTTRRRVEEMMASLSERLRPPNPGSAAQTTLHLASVCSSLSEPE